MIFSGKGKIFSICLINFDNVAFLQLINPLKTGFFSEKSKSPLFQPMI